MEFQVVTDKRLSSIHAGQSLLTFHFRKDMGVIAAGIDAHKTETGTMQVSGAELTALDLLRYPDAAGGIDAIATVLMDLAPKINTERLAALGHACERSVVRLSVIFSIALGHPDRADLLHGPNPICRFDKAKVRPSPAHNSLVIVAKRAPNVVFLSPDGVAISRANDAVAVLTSTRSYSLPQ
jgi:hypothetical protein